MALSEFGNVIFVRGHFFTWRWGGGGWEAKDIRDEGLLYLTSYVNDEIGLF